MEGGWKIRNGDQETPDESTGVFLESYHAQLQGLRILHGRVHGHRWNVSESHEVFTKSILLMIFS